MHRWIAIFFFLVAICDAFSQTNSFVPKLVVARDRDGQPEVFEVSPKGELLERRRNAGNGAWSAWYNLGGAVRPDISVTTNADGQMQAFAVSLVGGSVEYISHFGRGGADWSEWTNLGGNFDGAPAVCQNQDGRMEVFAVDARDHSVRHISQATPYGPWRAWVEMGGSFEPGMALARNRDGRLELFAIAREGGGLMHCWQLRPNTTNQWSPWQNLGGAILPGMVIGQNAVGRLEVFGINRTNFSANRICQAAASTSTNWTPWLPFGGTFHPFIAWGQSGDKRMELYAVNAGDNTIVHRWEDFPNGSDVWSKWKSLVGTTIACPAVGCNEEGCIEVFAVDPTNVNKIHFRRQISSASDWLDWADLDEPAFQFMSRSWQASDGLPDNLVQAIAQTPDGYLWVGTRNGLARFDGIRFVRFDPRNTPELENASITTLCASGDGALWIGTGGGGVTRFQDGQFTHFGKTQGIAGNEVRVIYESAEGSIWIGTTTGMTRYRNKQFVNYTTKDGLSSDVVNFFCHDRDGNLWIATSQGLNRLKKGGSMDSFAMPNGLPNNSVRAIFQDKGGRIWIGSNNGLLWYDQVWANHFFAYNTKYGLSDVFVTAVCEGRDGNLWVGTFSGLNRFYGSRFYPQLDNEGQPFGKVNALFEDSEGDVWVGTQEGLIRLTRNYFFTYTQRDGLTHNNIMSVLQDRHGAIWAGTWGGGLDVMKGEATATGIPTNIVSQSLILSLCEGRDGSIWTGADFDGGLTRLKDGKARHYTWREGLPNGRIQALHEDEAGNLWIGTSAGLSCLRDGKFVNYTTTNGLTGNDVRAIESDHAGNLWFGTDEGLSCRTNGHFDFVDFTRMDGLADGTVTALYSDKEGSLWAGTDGGGLSRLKNGVVTTYTSRQGLFSEIIYSIIEDDRGWLWLSCPQGIYRVLKSDFDAVDSAKSKMVTSIGYGKLDGMQSPQCNGAGKPSVWRSADGRLWFPTTRGLVSIDPDAVKMNPRPPTVCIEQLIEDQQPRLSENAPHAAGPAGLKLPPGLGELEFQYTALNLSAPEKSRFAYKLDGLNTEWVDAGARRSAYYDNLAPGMYEFHVRACNKDGVWNEHGASISFILTPMYWQTWWFKAAVATGLAGLACGAAAYSVRLRVRRKLRAMEQQQAIEKERHRIAQDMHDQLGAGLTQIGLLGEFARRDQAGNGHATGHVEKICDVTRELAQTVDEIVWAVNPRNDTLNKLAVYLAAYAEEFFQAASIRCRLDIPAGLPAAPLSAEVRHNVFLVVKEALNNVVKHSQATEVRVSLTLHRHGLEIRIEDDGRGFAVENAAPDRNGVRNMRERLNEIHGSLDISSAPQKGTRVSLSVPIHELSISEKNLNQSG